MGRLASVVIGVILLLGGAATFAWQQISAVATAGNSPSVAVDWQVHVVDERGTPVSDRLAVIFVDGSETGRTDLSGRLRGLVPAPVANLGAGMMIREGAARVLSLSPAKSVVVYAFRGETSSLPFSVVACRLVVTRGGDVVCPSILPAIPALGQGLMSLLIGMLLFPLALVSTRQVTSWPREMPQEMRTGADYLMAVTLSGLVVLMFNVTGVNDRWIVQLADIFAGAVDGLLAAMTVVVAVSVIWIQIRARFFRP